jgi:hypothetical protein
MELLVNQKLRAADTDAVQNIHDVREELDEVDGAGQLEMAKMPRAAVIRLAAATACFAIVEDTHAGIKEAADARLTPIICSRIGNLHHGTLLDFLRPKDAELDPHHRLDIRIWAMNSGRHLSSVL